MVVGPDGQSYGPADVATLATWAAENRIAPNTTLKAVGTDTAVPASAVPGIFPSPAMAGAPVGAPPMQVAPVYQPGQVAGQGQPYQGQPVQGQTVYQPGQSNWSQPPTAYPRGSNKPYYGQDTGAGDIWMSLLRSALAIVLFFFLGGLGLITAVYGLIYSVRALQKGHKFGPVAVGISVVTLIAVGIGWFFRLQSGRY